MRKLFSTISIIICIVILFTACGKKKTEKFINDKGVEEQIKIIRFDKELFAKPLPNLNDFLVSLSHKYPEMFQQDLSDKQYMNILESFISDEKLRDAQNIVEKLYPELNSIEKDLTQAFAHLKSIYPNTQLPKRMFAFIIGPVDFSMGIADRVYHGTLDGHDYYTIALDMYSMPEIRKNPYYTQIPEYLLTTLNKQYIAPDFIRMYLRNVACKDIAEMDAKANPTLLDCIVQDGKYSYFVQQLLPAYDESKILRYNEQQLDWCKKNEKIIWGYIIQNRLLYEKDMSKYMSLIAEGPTTKPLDESPSRTGNYIGYKIVQSFMNKQNISLDSLMKIQDSQLILKQSHYKPQR